MTPSREYEINRQTFPGFAGFRDDSEAPFYTSRMPRFRTSEATAAEIVPASARSAKR